MESSKWVATVASIWIQLSIGASYAFGVYSPVLKSSQGYDQSTLDSVAVFKDIGANFGLLSGLLYTAVVSSHAVPHSSSFSRWIKRVGGPWVVITAGAIQCFTGYFFMWLAVTGIIPRPPVPLMCLFMFLAAHAQTFSNTANVVTAVQNFPDYSGTIVGIIKGFLGLSGAILIQVYQTIFQDKPSSFILMLALLPTIVPLLLMSFVKIKPTRGTDEKKHLNGFSVIALLIAAYLMVLIISENVVTFGLSTRIITLIVLLLGLASPVGIAIRAHLKDSQKFSPPSSSHAETPLLNDHEDQVEVLEKINDHPPLLYRNADDQESSLISTQNDEHKMKNPLEPELNLLEAMQTIDFWLLFLAMACGLGSGMATVNNIGQIGGSLGYTSVETRTLVSLWSIWNFLGRFGAGFVSDYFLHLRGWARPIFMAITLASMSIGHLVIASGLPGALYAGSTLVGVFYGSQWSLFPTITSEIFGVTHLGTIFNTVALASPVGSYILSVRVVGYIYDREALSDSGNTCIGLEGFMNKLYLEG
ncbi:Nodulin-like [Macleaya cordata]|uniref:Nodulin-like n=1 Tax=Macleaya cordata TaxID=56857 RepID=A0A200QNH4_MACCD|nr:Nodulin-like [Macleaya cordata]